MAYLKKMWAKEEYKVGLTRQLAELSCGVVNLGIIKAGFTVAWDEIHETYRKICNRRPQKETKHLKWTIYRLSIDHNFGTKKENKTAMLK
jgi:hypothetical protein